MKKILIIDDDVYIGNMLEELLTGESYGYFHTLQCIYCCASMCRNGEIVYYKLIDKNNTLIVCLKKYFLKKMREDFHEK